MMFYQIKVCNHGGSCLVSKIKAYVIYFAVISLYRKAFNNNKSAVINPIIIRKINNESLFNCLFIFSMVALKKTQDRYHADNPSIFLFQ